MTSETRRRLEELNRRFYEDHARTFSDTRSPSGAELEWIIPWIPAGARVLDLGCGNGRAARLLALRGVRGDYVGVDASAGLLRHARESVVASRRGNAAFVRGDLIHNDIPALLARERIFPPFDAVLMLAVLHHVPGAAARREVLRQAAALLAPKARLLVSTWQFPESGRMRRKIVPWSVAGIAEDEVDPGDALLGWRGGEGYRYCHWIGEQEMHALAHDLGLSVVFTTRAGGREGTLSLCAVLER